MTYEYACPSCAKRFDVIKTVSEMNAPETCACGTVAERQFVPSRVHFVGAKVQHAEWNPAFGQVVKDKYHRSELAKRHGMVEIGNDYKTPDKIHETFDKVREEKREKRWSED